MEAYCATDFVEASPASRACRTPRSAGYYPAQYPLTRITYPCARITALPKTDQDLTLRRFWEVENVPERNFPTKEDAQCEEHFLATHSRGKDGRYIIRLPFRHGPPRDLGQSRPAALASLHRRDRAGAAPPARSRKGCGLFRLFARI